MGTWSISPSSDIASINSSTGEASFGEHTSDITYTITYNDSTCGSITKSFTVHKCGTPSTCTCDDLTVNGKTIDSEGGSNITIGTYSTTCVTNIGASADKEWVTSISANGDAVKATVEEYTSTTVDRSATITVTGTTENNTCSKTFTLTQKKQGGGGCTECISPSSNLTFGANTDLTKSTTYTPSTCDYEIFSKPSWITNVNSSNGTIAMTAETNTEGYRNDYVYFKKPSDGSKCPNGVGVSQYGTYTVNWPFTLTIASSVGGEQNIFNSVRWSLVISKNGSTVYSDGDDFIKCSCSPDCSSSDKNSIYTRNLTGSFNVDDKLSNYTVQFSFNGVGRTYSTSNCSLSVDHLSCTKGGFTQSGGILVSDLSKVNNSGAIEFLVYYKA